jgi:Zn-dependent peptidase ImmA (M78 family)/DNA-binding XRE family transcriptional regulator
MQEKLFEIRQAPVNGGRVRQARELKGLTQALLSDALGVDQAMVAHIERGTKQPGEELLDALSSELQMPVRFFRQGSRPQFPKGSLLFRSKQGIGKRTISQAHAHAEVVFEFVMRLSEKASLIPVRLPNETDPIEAARQVRELLNVPGGPLPNLIRAAEKLGVITIPLPDLRDCDAFAVWAGPLQTYPVIGLVIGKANDRTRMNVAHELGHLILHRNVSSGEQGLEMQAYRFAAELLMPTQDMARDLSSERLTLFRLATLKKSWQVSMQALARRARDLEAISDRQYRYLMQQMSMKGWRTDEPNFTPQQVETPRLIPKLAEVALGLSPSLQTIANDYCLTTDFIAEVLHAPAKANPSDSAKLKSRNADVVAFSKKRKN